MIRKQYLKFSILLCLSVGAVFSIFSIVLYFGDWLRALFVFLFGLFVGALAIPEIETEAVKNPVLFQTVVGIVGGSIAAVAFQTDFEYVIYSSIIGALLGFTSHYWIKYVQIP